MTRRLWLNSHRTKRNPKKFPTRKSLQNHLANLAPARIPKPTMIGAIKAAIPISELGKPRSFACQVSITVLQEMNMLRSQPRTAPGSVATWIRSKVRENAPIQPMIPKIIRTRAKDRGAPMPFSTVEDLLIEQVCHAFHA